MTPFRKFCLFVGLLTYLFASVAYGDEEIYSYIDKDGTLVFTNIKPAHLKPTKEKKRLNTFSWTDELGVLRKKVHRVNVTSYDREILEAAKYYTLPPELVKAVVAVESSFEPTAISPAGAQGLMQLMPKTGQEMQLRDPFHPAPISMPERYLRILANQFDGDIRKTIAGYNAGPGAVRRAGRCPQFPGDSGLCATSPQALSALFESSSLRLSPSLS